MYLGNFISLHNEKNSNDQIIKFFKPNSRHIWLRRKEYYAHKLKVWVDNFMERRLLTGKVRTFMANE